jgi:ankyrin repeat protein
LAQNTDPNIADSAGWRALHFAAQKQDGALIQLLITAGAEVDAPDGNGNTPLSTAVFAYRGSPDAIRTLKNAGADETRANNHGVSPRSLAEMIANYDVKSVL